MPIPGHLPLRRDSPAAFPGLKTVRRGGCPGRRRLRAASRARDTAGSQDQLSGPTAPAPAATAVANRGLAAAMAAGKGRRHACAGCDEACAHVCGDTGVSVCVCVSAQRAGSCETPWPVSCETRQKPGRVGGDVTARAAPRAGRTRFSGSQGCDTSGSAAQHALTPALGTVTAASGLPVTFLTRLQPSLLPVSHRCGPP